eukprot:353336-Chlamydomonas_euryale.AAC.6
MLISLEYAISTYHQNGRAMHTAAPALSIGQRRPCGGGGHLGWAESLRALGNTSGVWRLVLQRQMYAAHLQSVTFETVTDRFRAVRRRIEWSV